MGKITTSLAGQDRGRIAETLAHNVIRLFPGISDVSYFREPRGESEIDFVVRIGSRMVPIEVCYQVSIDAKHRKALQEFVNQHTKDGNFGILVTKDSYDVSFPVVEIPLPFFLLAG